MSRQAGQYKRYAADAELLAAIGLALRGQPAHPPVHLPAELAKAAVEAWSRDESDEPAASETVEQIALRRAAGDLALIGLAISRKGMERSGGLVEVEIDLALIDSAMRASRGESAD